MTELEFVTRRGDIALATIQARRGIGADQIGSALGLAAPAGPGFANADGLGLIGTGPGSWLAVSAADRPDWPAPLETALAGLAAVMDQSGGYVLFRFHGEKGRALLQRGAAIDLHPDVFKPGSAATSVIAHIGVIFWRMDDEPDHGSIFDLAVFRSYEASFRHWINSAGAAL